MPVLEQTLARKNSALDKVWDMMDGHLAMTIEHTL
jgi:hypothetical protein